MKNIVYSLACLVAMSLFFACTKKKSDDLPLDKVHYNAVIVATENSNIISFESNSGAKLWEITTKGIVSATPVLQDSTLYALTQNGFLYKIDVIKGDTVWVKSTIMQSIEGMAIDGGKLYVAADGLYCYDLDGNMQWVYQDADMPCTSAPQVINGRAYVAVKTKVHCIDISNGTGVWISAASLANINSSVRVSNGIIYFGCDDAKVYAINAVDGSPKWNYTTGDKVSSSPVVYGGMCIAGSYDYDVHCIDTTTGKERWTFHTLERVHSSPTVHEFTNSVLVGSYDYNLYCIDHVSGTLRWKYPAGSLIKTSPVVMDNNVYFTSFDRYMYCVDVRDGRILWKQYLNGQSSTSPIADNLLRGLYPTESGMSNY